MGVHRGGLGELSPAGTINALSASPNNVVFALASDSSLWSTPRRLDELSPAGTILSVSGGADASGGAEAFAVASDHSLWQFDKNAWQLLSPAGTINSVSAVAGAAFAVACDGSMWQHAPGDGRAVAGGDHPVGQQRHGLLGQPGGVAWPPTIRSALHDRGGLGDLASAGPWPPSPTTRDRTSSSWP